jgi:hypothetical protein
MINGTLYDGETMIADANAMFLVVDVLTDGP